MLIDFKDEQFETQIKNRRCIHCAIFCRMVPTMQGIKASHGKIIRYYKDKANFYYADIENGGINTGSAAGVRGVPTVIVYKKGIEVEEK